MRKDETRGNATAAPVAEARLLAERIRKAIDDGSLSAAELFLVEAGHAIDGVEVPAGKPIGLTLALEMATIAQYRGDCDYAWRLANAAVEFADENFGPRGIHVGRARLRRNFALEAKREFSRALLANLELADELVHVPGSDALRLNCFTRALACAVKNTDRSQLRVIGPQAEPIWRKLERARTHDKSKGHPVSRWFLYWCAIASMRQMGIEDAENLLDYAAQLGPGYWRWKNAEKFARAHAMTLRPATRSEGEAKLVRARRDAEQRGFHGLVRSIDAGLNG